MIIYMLLLLIIFQDLFTLMILTVGKSLREFKAGNSIEEETFDDILDELNNPKIYV